MNMLFSQIFTEIESITKERIQYEYWDNEDDDKEYEEES